MATIRRIRVLHSATLCCFAALFGGVHSHALPRPTPTLPLREFDVDVWPPAPTNPYLPSDELLRRQFNTICGYIGGDPALPATCSAGSHCAADSQNSVIGCCPDVGPCTQGIFTGCVDRNSNPQTEINPYVFTCTGGDVCYQNQFAGGFSQYGCGSASSLANTVAMAPSGAEAISIVSVSIDLTASATSLSEPTTIGTRTRASSTDTIDTSSERTSSERTSSERTSSSTSTTISRSSTSDESTTQLSETSTPVTSTSASSSSSAPPNIETEAGSAPDNEDERTDVGAIVGGSVGGVAGVAIILTLAIWLWWRKNRNTREGPGLDRSSDCITPMTDNRQQFTQLPTTWEESEPEVPPSVPKTYGGLGTAAVGGNSVQNYGSYSMDSTRGAAVGGSGPFEPDREPLTGELDDFSRGFNTALVDIDGNDDARPNSQGMGAYTRSRDGGRPLWQQNRRRSQNMTWL
ncbi:hypothetical protein NLU13_0906 [Sarocladium strictum]|uniref:Mid2 domain-containing protein n=1 Tax=Sarocladium strictum TaxID=5046 RepID=A0AA39GQQ5_SARSR|nr:hypothetical protein NLU13_0906 [Sarocladium strictum]